MDAYAVEHVNIEEKSTMFFNTPSSWAKDNLLYLEWYGHFFCTQRYRTERATFNSSLLIFTLNGIGKVTTSLGTSTCKKGDIALVNCKESHLYFSENDWEFLWFHFNGNASEALVKLILENNDNVIRLTESALSSYFFDLIAHGKESKSLEDEVEISAYIHMILSEMLKHYGSDQAVSEKKVMIKEALGFIEQHYTEKITMEQIAGFLKISSSSFSHMFKKEIGFSPYEYIMNKRMNKAKELLKMTTKSVEEISYVVGFNSVASFVKTFKDRNTMTPNVFRNTKTVPVDFVETN